MVSYCRDDNRNLIIRCGLRPFHLGSTSLPKQDYLFFRSNGLSTGLPGKYHGIVWAACAVTLLSILTCSSSGFGSRTSTCPGSLTVRYSSFDLECKNFRITSRSCLSVTPSTSTVEP